MDKLVRRLNILTHQFDIPTQNDTLCIKPTAGPHRIAYAPPKCDYNVIIIGGGIHGASTADALSKMGKKVLLLEQFDVNHEEGSSHGDGRIIRYSYPESIYIEMSKLAYPLWKDIEQRSGTKVTHITGGITFGPADDTDLIDLINNMRRLGIPFEELTMEEANKRFPMYKIPAGNRIVYQKDSGVAFASKAVKALWELARKQGATILARERVVNLRVASAEQVEVATQSGKRFTGEKLVVAAGAWAKSLLLQLNLDLPLYVTQEQVYYWKEKKGNLVHHMHNMPVFIVHGKQQFYGLPQIDIPGVKVGWHHSGREIDVTEKNVPSPNLDATRQKTVSEFVSRVFPDLAHEAPDYKLYCLYTSTPDNHFIIDYHPQYKNVIIGSPCSGHGFKFGPVVGLFLAQMAIGENLPISLDMFKISRFSLPVAKRTGV